MLSPADRETLVSVQRIVRAWGTPPLLAEFDALVGTLEAEDRYPLMAVDATGGVREIVHFDAPVCDEDGG